MKFHTPAISLVLMMISSAAFAADPPAPAAPAAPVAPAAPATAAASPATPAPQAAGAPGPIDSQSIAKAAHSLGYKTRQHEGKTYYCKSETKVGTSFQTTTCLTEDQVMATVKRAEGNRDSVEALQRAFLVGAPSKEPFNAAGSMRGQ